MNALEETLLKRLFLEEPDDHPERAPVGETPEERIKNALALILTYGGYDGAHHKDWVLDRVVRALAGDAYERLVAAACDGEDGPGTYSWETGIAP